MKHSQPSSLSGRQNHLSVHILIISVLLLCGVQAQTNVGLSKPAYASSQENASLNAPKGNDGSTGTRFSTSFADNQWWYVDLQSTYSLSRIFIDWEGAYTRTFRIGVAPDGTANPANPASYTEIYYQGNKTSSSDDNLTVSGSGRYVMIHCITRATAWGNSFWEFQVWGSSGPQPGLLSLQNSSSTVSEGVGNASFKILRTGGSEGAVSCTFRTYGNGGGATAGADYTTVNQAVSFTAGQIEKTVTVPILEDAAAESSESFGVEITAATGGASIGSPAQASVTITDNDLPVPGTLQFQNSSYTVAENGGQVTLRVTRMGGSDGTVGVTWATANGSASGGSDFTQASGTLSFSAGVTYRDVSISITDDANMEAAETFNVSLSSPSGGASLGSPSSVSVTITDNDQATPAGLWSEDGTTIYRNVPSGSAVEVRLQGYPTVKTSITHNQIKTGKVIIGDWTIEAPDYVFADEYNLKTLEEIEKFILAHKHLPDVPSAADMKKDGVDLSDLNMVLLRKIEELTLYAIELNRKIESLEKKDLSHPNK